MIFDPPLQSGQLVARYKRFLTDVQLDNGEVITIHCANTGAMTGCADPGTRVWYSTSDNPKRKLPNSWEIAESPAGHFICARQPDRPGVDRAGGYRSAGGLQPVAHRGEVWRREQSHRSVAGR